jgi:23S rRNA (cytidine1920-2'-O)/16S rRNA (cytidine1409-2'-O)-methyltransferase
VAGRGRGASGGSGRAGEGKKQRLDQVLVSRGLFNSRSQAAAAVLAGTVRVDGVVVDKAGSRVRPGAGIEVDQGPRFVSRGGLKLERAFQEFTLDIRGRDALDGGASTGGFSDCMLSHGAVRVIAVDVGYGQLDWKLRQDPRVVVMERTNIRYLKPEDLPFRPSFAALDLSFISLKKVIPAVIECLTSGGEIVVLIKPQFEAGRGKVGGGGVVRDPEVHRQVLESLWRFAEDAGLSVRGLTDSGIRGPSGNVEYLMYLSNGGGSGLPSREQAIEELLKRVEGIISRP